MALASAVIVGIPVNLLWIAVDKVLNQLKIK